MTNPLSLLEINNLVKLALRECLPDKYWVRAELSEVRTTSAGHCYVEFIEKESRNGNIIAKMRGNIWANTFRILSPYFEKETGRSFSSGLKVLVQVTVDFHEVYGPSLTVSDIDPTFTLGDMMQQRLEIIRKLKSEGLFELNKQHVFPILPRRLAIISSSTAAGYDDFINQLENNDGKYTFRTKLFPALMQGAQAESTILKAMKAIEKEISGFDAVLILRGGGATSDLNCFDSYLLAKACATFQLPIITGIGHERDESILDKVAHTRMKTPTAAAEFLISCFEEAENHIYELQEVIIGHAKQFMVNERNRLNSISMHLSHHTQKLMNRESLKVREIQHLLKTGIQNTFSHRKNRLNEWQYILKTTIQQNLTKEQNKLSMFDQIIRLSSPETMLKKGFTLTLKDGKIIRSSIQIKKGDLLTTHFADGERHSIATD